MILAVTLAKVNAQQLVSSYGLLMNLRPLFVAALGVIVVAACGSSSSTINGGTDGGGSASDGGGAGDDGGADSGVKARVILKSALAACANAGAGPAIGDFTTVPKRAVDDGTAENGHPVSVTCKVAAGSGVGPFVVSATITLGGVGTLTLSSGVDINGASSAAKISLAEDAVGTWSGMTCTLDPTVDLAAGVAIGRYWAGFKCTQATNAAGPACDLQGEVRIENCAQN